MARFTNETALRVDEVASAWGKMRPAKSFYGMTLEDFRKLIKPFTDARKRRSRTWKFRCSMPSPSGRLANYEAMKAARGVINAREGRPHGRRKRRALHRHGIHPEEPAEQGPEADAKGGSAEGNCCAREGRC